MIFLIYLSIYLPLYLPTNLSIYLSIYLSETNNLFEQFVLAEIRYIVLPTIQLYFNSIHPSIYSSILILLSMLDQAIRPRFPIPTEGKGGGAPRPPIVFLRYFKNQKVLV